jgi:hypothetical protein
MFREMGDYFVESPVIVTFSPCSGSRYLNSSPPETKLNIIIVLCSGWPIH